MHVHDVTRLTLSHCCSSVCGISRIGGRGPRWLNASITPLSCGVFAIREARLSSGLRRKTEEVVTGLRAGIDDSGATIEIDNTLNRLGIPATGAWHQVLDGLFTFVCYWWSHSEFARKEIQVAIARAAEGQWVPS